jgi:hypothetical protein
MAFPKVCAVAFKASGIGQGSKKRYIVAFQKSSTLGF